MMHRSVWHPRGVLPLYPYSSITEVAEEGVPLALGTTPYP